MRQLKFAWQKLASHQLTTLFNVLGLTLGILSCLILYVVTNYELGFDRFHQSRERIYRVVLNIENPTTGNWYRSQVPVAAANEMQQHFTGIEEMSTFFSYAAKITVSGENGMKRKISASSPSETIIPQTTYFNIFSYHWLYGSAASSLANPYQLVLTASRATELFGQLPLSQVIGKEVIYDDSLRLRVSGILEDWKQPSDLRFREFISFPTIAASFLKNLGDLQFAVNPQWNMPDYTQNFLRLAPGATIAQFETQALKLVKDHMTNAGDPSKISITLEPLSSLHLDPRYSDFYSRQADLSSLHILMGIAGFIVLIAILNFVNLSTAQNLQRTKEVGIRKILGSGRAALIGQFLLETFLLTFEAAGLALVIIRPILHALREWLPTGLTFSFADPLVYCFILGTALLTALLAGLYPALRLAGTTAVQGLVIQSRDPRGQKLRRGLIVVQFTLAALFISATLVIGQQTNFLLHKPLGFNQSAIITIPTSDNYPTDQRNLLAERLRRIPGVKEVSSCWTAPMLNYNRSEENYLERLDHTGSIACSERTGDEYYLPLFGIRIVAGRNIVQPSDDTANFVPSQIGYGYMPPKKHTEIIINETCARALGFKRPVDALGHIVRTPAPDQGGVIGPIVGVMADFHAQSLFSPMRPVYFYGSHNLWRGTLQVKINQIKEKSVFLNNTFKAIEKNWKSIFPQEDFTYWFVDASIAQSYRRQEQTTAIISAAMVIALFISCIGLLAQAIFAADQRGKEIGIRKVLGSSVAGIMLLLSADFLKLVGWALMIATPLGWYLCNRWLQNFAFHISLEWWHFGLAGLATVAVALFSVGFETYKAATRSAVHQLKTV